MNHSQPGSLAAPGAKCATHQSALVPPATRTSERRLMNEPEDNSDSPHDETALPEHRDPDGEAPWAMQLVVRVEKDNMPTRAAACEAAATAVARLLADDQALPGGAWHQSIERWLDGRIRKHCRRARGAAWSKVHDVAGITVNTGAAEVRAFVPTATDTTPRDVAKLQLSGSELDNSDTRTSAEAYQGGPVVVSLCPEPFLPVGKAAAAAGHASQLAASKMDTDRYARWAESGFAVVVEQPDEQRWTELVARAPVVVVDAGLTVVAPGTVTALARWV